MGHEVHGDPRYTGHLYPRAVLTPREALELGHEFRRQTHGLMTPNFIDSLELAKENTEGSFDTI